MEDNSRIIYDYLCELYSDISRYSIDIKQLKKASRIEEVYSYIIVSAVKTLTNRGLCSTYKEVHNVEMSSPRGRINIAESIRKQSLNRGKLVCSYNEYTNDVEVNQIIKTALNHIMDEKYISDEMRNRIAIALKSFNGVSCTDMHRARTAVIRYDNNSYRYRPVIWMIQQILDENNISGDIEYRLFKSQLHKLTLRLFEGYNVYIDTVKISVSKYVDDRNDYEHSTSFGIRTADKGVLVRTERIDYNDDNTELVKEFSEDIVSYGREYGVKASGLIIAVNCDGYDIVIREDESCSIGEETIIRTFINFYDSIEITSNKIRGLIREIIGTGRIR